MLGRVDPQLSLLDAGSLLEGLVDEDSFYGRLAKHGRSLVGDEEFADCYAAGWGRPSIPPSTLMLVCLLAMHDGTSDRQTAQQVRLNLGWKTALGLPIDHPGFHPTTFSVFRSRIVLHQKDEQLFRAVVDRAVAAGVLPRRSLQLIDSSPILGAGAVMDTYELLRSAMGRLVGAAGHDTLSKALQRQLKRYLGPAKPKIDWQAPEARRAELARMVAAADRLLAAAADRPECVQAAELLGRLLAQDVDRHGGDGQGPTLRQQVARDRVVSTSDPEMRHGRKSRARKFDGYKLHRAEEPGSELITAIDVTAANTSDGDVAAGLVGQADRNGAAASELVGDMAYGDGDTRAEVAAAGVRLTAKVPPAHNHGRFTKQDFTIDPHLPSATCPGGHTTSRLVGNGRDRHGRQVFALVFPTGICAACPLRQRCVAGSGPRSVALHPHEALLQQARAAQQRPAVKRKLRRRPIIERKIDHCKDAGAGKARYRGRRKVLLQARLAAVVVNLKRLAILDALDTVCGSEAVHAA